MLDARLNVLLLCDYPVENAATMVDHVNAFYYLSRHRILVLPLRHYRREIPAYLDLDRFDAVILHYSLTLAIDAYISEHSRQRLQAFSGVKALFIQDEYRFVDRTIELIDRLGFQILFTCVPEAEIEKVYSSERLPNVCKLNVLTGYVPHALLLMPTVPLHKRPIDIGYRGRRYPHWHGQLGREKWEIAERVKQDARRLALRTDISVREQDRLYGAK